MESSKTTRITHEVIRLMNLQVEALKEPILAMTVGEVHDYDERRNRIGQLAMGLEVVKRGLCFLKLRH